MKHPNQAIDQRDERARYIVEFNTLMFRIWKEQITKLKVIDTGNLYASVVSTHLNADDKIIDISMQWQCAEYGIYQDRGTGRETPRGNPGDIGRAKIRQRRPWLSKRFYSSYCNIRDFMAESLGAEFVAAVPRILGSSKF